MMSLVLAAVFFVGLHLVVSGTALRARLLSRLGTKAYMGLFSAASAIGLAWLIVAFLQARTLQPTALMDWRWLAVLLNFLALLFISFGVLTRSPTAVAGEARLDAAEPATGLHRVTRHPMLWGFALWAVAHMVFNPQLPALLFFGAFLVLALVGPRSIDAKRAAAQGEKWHRYAAVTSSLPFLAIAQGRNRLVWRELLTLPLVVAAVLTELLLLFHAALFGLPAY